MRGEEEQEGGGCFLAACPVGRCCIGLGKQRDRPGTQAGELGHAGRSETLQY